MRCTTTVSILSATLLLGLSATATRAALIGSPLFTLGGNEAQRNPGGNGYSGAVGGVFTVGPSDMLVTALGFADGPNVNDPNAASPAMGDGLMAAHEVGIFPDGGGTTLADVTIPLGTDAALSGNFRFVTLDTPVVLQAGRKYVLSGQVTGTSDDVFFDASKATVTSSDASAYQGRYAGPNDGNDTYLNGAFAYPSYHGNDPSYLGPNLLYAVPDPPARRSGGR